jgi:hypothetical protein
MSEPIPSTGLRFVGCCHPKAKDDGNPQDRRGEQLTLSRMQAAVKQLKEGKQILDNHHPDRVVGRVYDAWIDPQKQLWVLGWVDDSTPVGKEVAECVRQKKYLGLSLGMVHSVLRNPRFVPGAHQRTATTAGASSPGQWDEDDWSDVFEVTSSTVTEVSLCENGKYEHTFLATFFSKNPPSFLSSTATTTTTTTTSQGDEHNNNNISKSGDFNESQNSLTFTETPQRESTSFLELFRTDTDSITTTDWISSGKNGGHTTTTTEKQQRNTPKTPCTMNSTTTTSSTPSGTSSSSAENSGGSVCRFFLVFISSTSLFPPTPFHSLSLSLSLSRSQWKGGAGAIGGGLWG